MIFIKILWNFQVALSQVGVKFKSHSFLLSPVSAQAHVKRNRSEQPLRSRFQPRIVCDLHLEEVPLSLFDVSLSGVFKIVIYNILVHNSK